MSPSDSGLKVCPVCHNQTGALRRVETKPNPVFYVACTRCGATTPAVASRALALREWNGREQGAVRHDKG